MRRAADWLVETQDADGCWRRHPTPFAEPGEKVYETHVAWGPAGGRPGLPGKPLQRRRARQHSLGLELAAPERLVRPVLS